MHPAGSTDVGAGRAGFHAYAATWDGGDHGGYMWGKVVKGAKEEPKGKEKAMP